MSTSRRGRSAPTFDPVTIGITYDREVDTLVVRLGNMDQRVRTVELAPDVLIDLAADGTPLEIEILGAVARYGAEALRSLPPPSYPPDEPEMVVVDAPEVEARVRSDLAAQPRASG